MKRHDGFTLVELLVVIAVISVLAAMLFPALQQAIDVATTTSCIDRERQIYLLAECFRQDKGHYVTEQISNALVPVEVRVFSDCLRPYLPAGLAGPIYDPAQYWVLFSQGYPYIERFVNQNNNLLFDPGSPYTYDQTKALYYMGWNNTQLQFFGRWHFFMGGSPLSCYWASMYFGHGAAAKPLKFLKQTYPIVLFTETHSYPNAPLYGSIRYNHGPQNPAIMPPSNYTYVGTAANFCYTDGHVETHRYPRINNQPYPPGSTGGNYSDPIRWW